MKSLDTRLGTFGWLDPGILNVTAKKIDPTVEEVEEYLAGFETMIEATQGPYVVFVDSRASQWMNAKARAKLGQGANVLEKRYRERLRGSFVVVSNPAAKLMLQGVNQIFKPIAQQRVFSSYDKGLKAARQMAASFLLENKQI